jgi:hypothetical protein
MAGMPTLAAVVPATDTPATVAECVAAIRSAAEPPEELVVVDRPGSCGPAEARNIGAAQTTAEVIVFVDADVVVHPDAFVRIRHAFRGDAGLVAVFGSYDDAPAAPGTVSRFRNLLHHHVHQQGAGRASTFWAGLGAVRRAAFLEVGGFDAGRFARASVEDIDLGMRLVGRGGRIVLDPQLQGTHLKAWSLPAMVAADFARRGVPWVGLLLRERAAATALNLGWTHRLSAAASVAAAVAAARRRPGSAAAALVVLLGVNRGFYALLLRRLGPVGAAGGIGLHVVHHLTAAAAVPAGCVAYALRARQTSSTAASASATSPCSR